jgi:hypothetical protein
MNILIIVNMTDHKTLKYLKDKNFNLINIETFNIKDKIKQIEILKQENKILYYFSDNIPFSEKQLMKIGFSIPTDISLLVLFYKGDYLYIEDDTDNIIIINKFIESANLEITRKCELCPKYYLNLVCCPYCGLVICQECSKKINKICSKCKNHFSK